MTRVARVLDAALQQSQQENDMNEQPHFSWCDLARCSAGRPSSPYYSHRSREFRGAFDPDSDSSINVSLVQFLRRHTLFLLEFCNDRCEGHEITPRQARELHSALGEYLAEVQSAECQTGATTPSAAPTASMTDTSKVSVASSRWPSAGSTRPRDVA
jgi:hypothetical protein